VTFDADQVDAMVDQFDAAWSRMTSTPGKRAHGGKDRGNIAYVARACYKHAAAHGLDGAYVYQAALKSAHALYNQRNERMPPITDPTGWFRRSMAALTLPSRQAAQPTEQPVRRAPVDAPVASVTTPDAPPPSVRSITGIMPTPRPAQANDVIMPPPPCVAAFLATL
jgi:hypothetical protein